MLILLIANERVNITIIDENSPMLLVNFLNNNFKNRLHIVSKIPYNLDSFDATIDDFRKVNVEKLRPGTFVYDGPSHKLLKSINGDMLTYRV